MIASNNSLPSADGTLMRIVPLSSAIIWSPRRADREDGLAGTEGANARARSDRRTLVRA